MTKTNWDIDRRRFLKKLAVLGIATQLDFLTSCSGNVEELNDIAPFFDDLEAKVLMDVCEILFPNNDNGPGIDKINVMGHILWSVKDDLYGYNAYEMLKRGLKKLKDHSNTKYGGNFNEINKEDKGLVISEVVKVKWGERFCSGLLNYIFESLSIDPLYNVNRNESGWKWLEHTPGAPRPNKAQCYPQFLNLMK